MWDKIVALPPSGSRVELWTELLNRLTPTTMLEIGVWKGDFAENALRTASSITRYYMIDPWRRLDRWNKPLNTTSEELEQAYQEALHATAFAKDKVEVLRGTTAEMIGHIPDESLDLAYVDGDHTLRGIAIDMICVYPKIKPGGCIGGDDFDPTIWEHGPRFEPTLVFPFVVYFAEAVGAELWALDFHQFLMRKPLNGGQFHFHDAHNLYRQTELLSLMSLPRRGNIIRRIANKLGLPRSKAHGLGFSSGQRGLRSNETEAISARARERGAQKILPQQSKPTGFPLARE